MTRHFIIVGAQRCGTTGLYQLLAQHPDICMARPIRPEPKFFLRKDAVEKGREDYLARHFAHHHNESVLGEKSTSYIEHDLAITNIRHVLPDAYLVFVLRDPAMRAYSNWKFSRSHGIEKLDFASALEAERKRTQSWDKERFSVCPYAYAERGHYPRYLERWAAHFPRRQLILMTSEHLFDNPMAARDLLDRIGVDASVLLPSPGKVNGSPAETSLPRGVLQRLRERYSEDIRQLTDEWGLDTTPWQN